MSTVSSKPTASNWRTQFDERQQKQIKWSEQYATAEFSHGDMGHNDKLIIAKMAAILDAALPKE